MILHNGFFILRKTTIKSEIAAYRTEIPFSAVVFI